METSCAQPCSQLEDHLVATCATVCSPKRMLSEGPPIPASTAAPGHRADGLLKDIQPPCLIEQQHQQQRTHSNMTKPIRCKHNTNSSSVSAAISAYSVAAPMSNSISLLQAVLAHHNGSRCSPHSLPPSFTMDPSVATALMGNESCDAVCMPLHIHRISYARSTYPMAPLRV